MSINDIIDRMVMDAMDDRSARIERALLEHDVVLVVSADRRELYRVPGWREAPLRRTRIAWHRRRHRRHGEGT